MFRLNLKIALRNLWKNKGYTFINIAGLSIGMASCILIFIFIRYQLSFDEGFKNQEKIYRFVSEWKYNSFDDYSQGVPVPLAAAARNEFAGIKSVASISREGAMIQVKDENGREKIKSDKRVFYAEPEFFDIFNMNWLAGAAIPGFGEPNTVVLSEKTAKAFFGSVESAIGKSFLLDKRVDVKVVAVFEDLPESSSFPLEIVISHQTYYAKDDKDWESVQSGRECYVLLGDGVQLSDLQKPLERFNYKYFKQKEVAGNLSVSFQSLKDIHFSERYGNFANKSITRKEIYGLGTIGLFLLITACINFINLATAQALNRSKEVGVRKVMGSRRKQLIVYFLTETLTITIIALLIACILAELVLPGMESLFGVTTSFNLFGHPVIFVFMAGLILFVSFLAGFYPAMVISGFSPALAIKNKVAVNAGGLSLRKVLVVVQFSITVMLIISTLVIMQQMEYVRQKPLGFNSDAVVMINAPADSIGKTKHNTFKERVLGISGVQMMSYCMAPPLSGSVWTTNFDFNGQENKDFEVRISLADENYFKLFGLEIIAGKVFKKSDTISGYVVNETFLKRLSISDPQKILGKVVSQNGITAPIVGVVKDFNDQSLRESISPLLIYSESRLYSRAAVKIDKNRIMPVMKEMESLWNSTFPNDVYKSLFLDEDISRYYENERIMGVLFKVFAGVIIFISFIGLFGLISFVATQRTKEVAIRKVLGASTYQLVKMLNSSFLLMVFIANMVAWPLAYLFVSKWLSGFAYRMELSIWPFLLGMCISMLITLITVSARSYRAAKTNPVDALKYE